MPHRNRRPAPHSMRLLGALACVGALALGVPAAPAAHAAPRPANTTALCEVSDATLTWGVKESFRSYISGSIANGEWTVSDDMRYETPSFIWDEASGAVAATLEGGEVSFAGAVHFTGHEGALEFDLSDPAIEFDSADTAYLTLTIGATDTANEGGTAEGERVRAAKMDLAGAVQTSGTRLDLAGAVPKLTSEGAAAFNGDYGSYVAGEELDPIALTLETSGCEFGAVQPTDADSGGEVQPTSAAQDQDQDQGVPWIPIAIGGAALLVIGVTGGMLFAGRKKPGAS